MSLLHIEYRTTVNGIEVVIEFILPQISSRAGPLVFLGPSLGVIILNI